MGDVVRMAPKGADDLFTAFADDATFDAPKADVPRRSERDENGYEHAELVGAIDAYRFLTAGNATVTFKSLRTGDRFTYKIKRSEDERMFFVSVLTGPDNESAYQYIGHVPVTSNVFWPGKKSKISRDAPSVKAFDWAWGKIAGGHKPAALEIWHSGRCGRCGRKLTVPESIRSGFGPECAGKL